MFDFLKRLILGPGNPTADLELIIHKELVIDFDRVTFNSIPMKSSFDQVKRLGRAGEGAAHSQVTILNYNESGFVATLENDMLVSVEVYITKDPSDAAMQACSMLTVIKDGSSTRIHKDMSFSDLVTGLGEPDDGQDFEDDVVDLHWEVEERMLIVEFDRADGVWAVELLVED